MLEDLQTPHIFHGRSRAWSASCLLVSSENSRFVQALVNMNP